MVAEVLDLVVAVVIEILAAVEVRVPWDGVLDAVLVEVGPSPIDHALEHLALLVPGYLEVCCVPDGKDVAVAVLEIVALGVVVEGQVCEIGSCRCDRDWVQGDGLVPIVAVAVGGVPQPVRVAVEHTSVLRQHVVRAGGVVQPAAVQIAVVGPHRLDAREVLDGDEVRLGVLDEGLDLEICHCVAAVLHAHLHVPLAGGVPDAVLEVDPVLLCEARVEQVVHCELEPDIVV